MSNNDGAVVNDTTAETSEAQIFGGVASFADAEAREILNLLNQGSDAGENEGGACCGGGCCS